jgi:hypothetical protein
MTIKGKTMKSVDVDWKEFYYTNCPLVSASNVDQELGWVKEEFKKIGVAYKYLRSTVENDWYPHYVHNLDNLMRFGGCHPAIHVQADIRRIHKTCDRMRRILDDLRLKRSHGFDHGARRAARDAEEGILGEARRRLYRRWWHARSIDPSQRHSGRLLDRDERFSREAVRCCSGARHPDGHHLRHRHHHLGQAAARDRAEPKE